MKSRTQQTLADRNVSRLRLMREVLITGLAIIWAVSPLAMRNRKISASAQESSSAITASSRSDGVDVTQSVPGDLDGTFGVDGTVATDLGNQLDDSASAVAAQSDGKVVAVGYVSTSSAGKDFAVIRLNPNGTLDSTFGSSGKLSFDFNSATRDDVARAVAIQSDGRIVIAGEADVFGFGNFDIVLARLNADGTFDTSFGINGKVVTNLPNNRPDYGRALVLQPDGRILVAGYSNRSTTGDDFVVVRYNSNGALDTTFGGSGIVTTDIQTNREDRAASIAFQADGNILVAGYTVNASSNKDFALVRYNANGSLDTSFNGTGKVTTDINSNADDIGNAVTLQSDGRILLAGQSAADFGLVRYNSNGSLDTSLGGGGIVTTTFGSGSTSIGRAVVVQSNGEITVAGRSRSELAFARYNPDGGLDSSFGRAGLLVQNAGNNFISAFGGYWGIALQADGKIIAAGDGWRDGFRNDFSVSRLNANGTFDFSFGGADGIASTDINGRFDEARSVAIQPDGKIVVAGAAQNPTGGNDFAVTRYNTDGTLDTTFGGDGIVTTDINGDSKDFAYAVALQPDGKIVLAGYTNDPIDGNLDDAVLLRYNANGTLDGTFGSGGGVVVPGSYLNVGPNVWLRNKSVAIHSDGKIVVAGEAHYFSAFSDAFVAQYNPNGSLDVGFRDNLPPPQTHPGFSLIHITSLTTFNAVAIQADGRIVAAGSVNDGPASDFTLVRVNSAGLLDPSFDGDGIVTTNFSNNHLDAAYDLTIQEDGQLIAVGETIASVGGSDFAIARYNPNGSLDTTFGGGTGMANINYLGYRDYACAVALPGDGKIILGGFVDGQSDTGWGVVKLNPDGTLDTTFGGGSGKVRTLFGDAVGSALDPVPYDMALQPDGKIVLAGRVNFNSTDRDFTVVRYQNEVTCTYMLNPISANFTMAAGNSTFGVIAPTGCAWLATVNVGWITITSGVSGTGASTVDYAVSANTAPTSRMGTITIAAETFTVNQAGTNCSFSLESTSISFGAAGGTGGVLENATSGCNWAATSNDSWITITSGNSGSGDGMVTYSVAENTASTIRNGTITVAGQPFTVYQGISFADVPSNNPFYNDIGKLAARGVTLGCGGGNYCPNDLVTREQMAAFILRAKGEFNPPPPQSQRFSDVPPQNVFYNFIDRLAVLQITLGCTPDHLMYCPSDPVKREQMAAFLLRGVGEFSPPPPGSQRFDDVPPANVFYNFIDRLAVLNITLGCTPDHLMYCPNDSVTRAQMAAFLVRAFNL